MRSDSPIPFEELLSALSRPSAFPGAGGTDEVECIQTHISAVFLVGNLAYKIKKPKDLGFLDFTSLEARRHYCHEEVRLNRRLAPGVYDGVVPVVREDGEVRTLERTVEPREDVDEAVVEWAVRMVRLPDDRTLGARLESGAIGSEEVVRVAHRIADFHRAARSSPEISAMGSWETVAANCRENFAQIRRFIGDTLSERVFRRLEAASERELIDRGAVIRERAARDVPRDTHGDLRLEHVYLLPSGCVGRSSTADAGTDEVVVIDCIEFNERYRWADPVADIAFLVMELEFRGWRELGRAFADAYFERVRDPEGRELLPFYATYRDVVRGKVRSLQADDAELPAEARETARQHACHHFLAGLVRLSAPAERPALVVVFGLPGVGKSTVAEGLARECGFQWIDTDRVRKQLAEPSRSGVDEAERSGFEEGLYSPECTERTYDACLRRATQALFEGGRVVVEGSFRDDGRRAAFLERATAAGVPALFLECRVGEREARRRLRSREAGPSDADWDVHRRMAERWEPVSPAVAPFVRVLPLGGSEEEGLELVTAILRDEGLAGGADPDAGDGGARGGRSSRHR